jgi:UDP-glucose 4-epimerase
MKSVLITGGAGYIGHNTVRTFQSMDVNVVSLDNMSRGHQWAKDDVTFIEGDISDNELVTQVIIDNQVDTIIHFAAFAYVHESIVSPAKYFDNNVIKSIKFIDTAIEAGVDKFIFSSSCAVYGQPESIPITEAHSTNPINPYGETKLFIEKVLQWYKYKNDIEYVVLRYFNAAGASKSNNAGEYHIPETHLIPLLIQNTTKYHKPFKIFGNDYETNDGTAIRDYIHIDDLSNAHYLAYKYLNRGEKSVILNLGTGKGHSILGVIRCLEEIINTSIQYKFQPRREGDPAALVASFETANKILGWKPKYGLKQILESAYRWEISTLPELINKYKRS